jgi:predicted secreted Zn-dependent protease
MNTFSLKVRAGPSARGYARQPLGAARRLKETCLSYNQRRLLHHIENAHNGIVNDNCPACNDIRADIARSTLVTLEEAYAENERRTNGIF